MAINRVSLTSESITTNTDAVIEIRYENAPGDFEQFATPEPPGKLIGYYNGASGTVDLRVVDGSGLRLLRI
jgi:hypothetical protein